jgi:hypothetical protein
MVSVIGLKDTEGNVETGLGTFTYNVPETGAYVFSVQSVVTPPSQLDISITQNATIVANTNTSLVNSNHLELSIRQMCTVGDVINFVLSSPAAIDSQAQAIKSLMTIVPQGQHT